MEIAKVHDFSFGGKVKVLKLGADDGCTTLKRVKHLLINDFKWVHFMWNIPQ